VGPHQREPEGGRGEPLRLAIILGQLDRGGSEGQALQLASGLAHRGHDVRVFSLRGGPRRREIDVPSQVAPFPFGGVALAACVSWLRGLRPQLAYTFGARAHLWGRLAARLCGVPRIVAGYRQQRHYWFDPLTLGWNAAIVCNARAVAELVARRHPACAGRLRVIPNGVDADRFAKAKASDLGRLGLRRPFVVQTARLHRNKDHATAFRALDLVRRARPELRLALLGDGPRRSELERLSRTMGLAEQVRFLGEQDVAPILAGAAVGWLSSRIEGSPNAVLEYMASGLPVVTTRAGGAAELVREGAEGFLCEPGDAEGIARQTLLLLSDEGLRAALGAAGRGRAALDFSLTAMVERSEALLREVVAGAGTSDGPRV
jgi:glycosyltransferase involved in cell wall biosynthesis